jgi:phosphatidylserine decarboxylase
VSERTAVILQYLLPKRAITVFGANIANAQAGGITHGIIRWFIGRYGVNMAEAANASVESYKSFNEFFTRELKPGVRPLANSAFVCPVDGAISQFGHIEKDQIFQAKGHYYSNQALVGGDAELAAQFNDGEFATIYLSPKDYHRIHMPCDGKLLRMIHVPGDLFSVNPTTARGVPGLFARNERIVCVFDSIHGQFLMVLVGATIVGSMATVWHGLVNATRPGTVREWHYKDQDIQLKKGDEMGRFLLGSTVVLAFRKNKIQFNESWLSAGAVKMGEMMGREHSKHV